MPRFFGMELSHSSRVRILGRWFGFALQFCALFRSWLGERLFGRCLPAPLPHGVEDGSVLHDAEQLVRRGHVVRDGPLAVPEEGVGRPDIADHHVVEPQDLDGAIEFQAFVDPRLTEEHVHGVFLDGEGDRQ